MAVKLIIYDSDKKWTAEVKECCRMKGIDVYVAYGEMAVRHKAVQDERYNTVILNIDIPNRTILETIRYLKLSVPATRIIVSAMEISLFAKFGLKEETLRDLGVQDILCKPYSCETLTESLNGKIQYQAWKDESQKVAASNQEKEEEVLIRDSDDMFTAIRIGSFFSGSVNIFDLYIRKSRHNYLRIFSQGKVFDHKKINRYNGENIEYVYFRTADRAKYITFTNKLLEKIIDKNIETEKKIEILKEVSEVFIDEIFSKGLEEQTVKEAESVCNNLYNMVKDDTILHKLLNDLFLLGQDFKSHLFGTTFFTSIICKNLEWTSENTMQKACLGALVHDIGKLKLPEAFRVIGAEEMTKQQRIQYETHSLLGVEMLHRFPVVTESVKQIVYQHHELANGAGFPAGISGIRIYPLARIVSLANFFSNYIARNNISPKEALQEIVQDRDTIQKFDANIIRALILGFMKKGSNSERPKSAPNR